jgi:hypothetical protein
MCVKWKCGSDDELKRTTPQAPCTPNWMQKAPAERALKEEGNIHKGIKAFIYFKIK